jgi:RNA polymerase sigma-70 factor (ECF subfamily)
VAGVAIVLGFVPGDGRWPVIRKRRRLLSPAVTAVSMPGGMGAAAAAAVAPSIATPILEESDASLGEPVDGNQDAHAEWVELVERIRSEKTDGMEELYQLFSRGIRFYLCRQLGPQELDDKVHDTFVVVVQAIRRGELREPQRLMGFVRTIVRRQVAAHIDRVVHNRREQAEFDSTVRVADPRGNPEEAAIFRQRIGLIRQVLGELSERDREILTRFYIDEQSQEQICAEMGLTETQFRLLKSRAKARFGELGKKKLVHKSLHTVFLRTSRSVSH